jgi:hypothetical protein
MYHQLNLLAHCFLLLQTEAPVINATPPATATALYTDNMSTILANHSGKFNETAFSQAVISVISSANDVTGIDVVVMSSDAATSRRLQSTATTSDLSVNYEVQHINGEATANATQKQLESSQGNAALVNSYKTLSSIKTVSAATTTRNGVPRSEVKPSTPSTPIAGIIAGVVVGVIAALLVLAMWCKRDALRAKCCSRQEQHKSKTEVVTALPDQESGLLDSTNDSFMNNNNGSSNRNNSISRFNSNDSSTVESFNFSMKRKPSTSSQALEETQVNGYQQQLLQHQQDEILLSQKQDTTTTTNAAVANSIADSTDSTIDIALKGSSKQYKPKAAADRSTAVASAAMATCYCYRY